MKQVMNIVRKTDFERKYVNGLKLELDYELATLFDAMNAHDDKQIAISKARLSEIHSELEALHALA
ncbi:hypothetical protein [Kurthia huakuii]|uniref:hypothetical protein n=1 Tax=Kurthia huakuii TaxID=1421019 RepID=UPI000496D0D4|nr:hypothetical protein [Kurthia huakuii]MBM7698440.1 hypothetical protein [Kurthia huakuii]